jgi:hypothetical protein
MKITLVLLLLFITLSLSQFTPQIRESDYTNRLDFEPEQKHSVFWVIKGDIIEFLINSEAKGWVSVGFDPRPGSSLMTDLDCYVAYVDNRIPHIEDRWSLEYVNFK